MSATELPVVTITRLFDAPRELVWQAWTDPRHLARWWGPKDSDNPICEIDVRPGGRIVIRMRGPSFDHTMGGEFREVLPPSRLVFTSTAFEDGSGGWALVNLNTVTFEDVGGRTRLTVRAQVQRAVAPLVAAALAGMEMGWTQSIDRLGGLLAHLRS